MRADKTHLFRVTVIIHGEQDMLDLTAIALHPDFVITAQEMRLTTTYGFSTGSQIPKFFHMRGLIGTGAGM